VRSNLTTRSPARYSARTTVNGSRSMSVKVLYTTHAIATGGLSQVEAEKLVAATHQVCPYSNATRGNLDVGLEISVV
jgi:organic hydroperoxide reductase OsmC/OhrA